MYYVTSLKSQPLWFPRSPRREKATICFEELCGLISHTDHPKWGGSLIYDVQHSQICLDIHKAWFTIVDEYLPVLCTKCKLLQALHVASCYLIPCKVIPMSNMWSCQIYKSPCPKTDMGPVWGFSSIAFKERRNMEVVLGGLCIFLPPNI